MNSVSSRIRLSLLAVCVVVFPSGFAVRPAVALTPQYGSDPGYSAPSWQSEDYRHRGYQDGMLDALRDLDHKRRPDPNNCREYTEPRVPSHSVDAYRRGFRSGYQEAVRELSGPVDRGTRGPGRNIAPRAYHEGAAGAIRDWSQRRPADPDNRDEYRKPHVPTEYREVYRESFWRGYHHMASLIY